MTILMFALAALTVAAGAAMHIAMKRVYRAFKVNRGYTVIG